MIPSLLAGELRQSIVEYLTTTFALSDDEAYEKLAEFLLDPRDGIFRGPYARVRLPFVDAPEDADLHVRWSPPNMRPYAHQLEAWERLSGRGGQPKPTLITTGTGSGKSEAFLVPIIDHCVWARERGQRGIKALLLYPMNALVADQERRIAAMLTDPVTQAAGVRAGVWIGDDGSMSSRRDMGADHLISDPAALMENPPDLLLTNYKMLDRLLTSAHRRRLWAANEPPAGVADWEQPLTYLVLDELHTYDGAQGTDVAMLLRRLGHRLRVATNQSPLGGVIPVGTSATLGSSPNAKTEMRQFAERIFGVRFDVSAIVGEQRRSVAEVCADIDFALPSPDPRDVARIDATDRDALARAFTGHGFDDAQAVGDRLVRHHLTASLLRVAAERPRQWRDAVDGVAQQVPEWGRRLVSDRLAVSGALERFIALISHARGRTQSGSERPLFNVEVQVWIREVTRLLRAVDKEPRFRWSDSAVDPSEIGIELPSVYCTACGRSGWMGLANRAAGQGAAAIERLVHEEPANVYRIAVNDRERTRVMLRAGADEPQVLWLDTESGQVHASDEDGRRIAVLVGGMTGEDRSEEARNEAAKQQRCPSCGTTDAIRFIGSRVTTLAAVGITQMFGSSNVADDERKLLAFTDSVQDASHRAAFFSGRTHRFNLRATMSQAVRERTRVSLTEIADVALSRADAEPRPADALFSLVPPDLLWESDLAAAWESPNTKAAVAARGCIAERLSFDAILEAGLRSRFGRTLETTNTAIPEIVVADAEQARIVAFAVDALHAGGLLVVDQGDVQVWVDGLLERLRLRGGIFHPFLDRYVQDSGRRWWIWGGGNRLAPKFPRNISAPAFFTAAASEDFDAITGGRTWVAQWTRKAVGLHGPGADVALREVVQELARVGVLEQRQSDKGAVWGLPAERLDFVDITPDETGRFPRSELRCNLCADRHHVVPAAFESWLGRPCLRLRCPGEYGPAPTRGMNYYRRLYRGGRIRRVVAAEHTGLLTRAQRTLIETGFKDGGTPSAPNVLTATPTLEMGIDIGDLSAVMLTAVPPTQSSYVQRVGRAGRRTGNAFITTLAEGDPRSLYFLEDPELMIAGDIPAPSCYLDAIEILRRQYLAFLVDRAAEGPAGSVPQAGTMPPTMGQLAANGLAQGGWLRTILDAAPDTSMLTAFRRLFGLHLDPAVAERLERWATHDMAGHVETVIERWRGRIKVLTNQRDRLRDREKELDGIANPTDEDTQSLGRVVAELRYLARRLKQERAEPTLNGLEALGLMPNYTLFDDSVTLDVSLWTLNERHDPNDASSKRFVAEGGTYERPATRAIRELAPGNFFYVDAHRVRIDAVDNGTESEPAHERWRLCAECAWASPAGSTQVAVCPRCGSTSVADQGALLDVLPLRSVSSTERETTARVGDESEDRDREFHELRTLVDIDPQDVAVALQHKHVVFGVESARSATIRYLNLGSVPGRNPRAVRTAGAELHAGLFRTCRHCGGVFGVRGDARDPADKNHHRSWCKVRSGARREQWDDLALVHELVTEAVRILLPVSRFEQVERVASFKAALMLGLRDSFGGEPAHLRVIESDFPAPGGEPDDRNRFLVVHDTVPGGTGYLPRLADADRLHGILLRARELITSCECQTRGMPGCHKCLYAGIERHELPRVSRTVALELLDEILADWKLERPAAGTITGVNLTPVVQSELERMFKVLLHRWTDGTDARLTARPEPEHPSRTRFDLRFQDGPHWEIREQVGLPEHHTIPDFYATRVDAPGTPPMAIYLDGWEYHGKIPSQVDDDATRRASLRSAGIGVWSMTWNDVKTAMAAATGTGAAGAGLAPLSGPARVHAKQGITAQLGPEHALAAITDQGPFGQLTSYLRHPAADAWAKVALAIALAPGPGSLQVDVADRAEAMSDLAAGRTPAPAAAATGIKTLSYETPGGFAVHAVLDQHEAAERSCSVVLSLDTAEHLEQPVWADWLHLGNLIAPLAERAVIATTSTAFAVTGERESGPTAETAPADALAERLEDCYDPVARELAVAVAEAGHGDFVVGLEPGWPDGTVLEIAWPQQCVGVLAAGNDQPAATDGWTVMAAGQWTVDSLLSAIRKATV